MDPVYAVVKAGSTIYSAVFLGRAQDVADGRNSRGVLLIALFFAGFPAAARRELI
jgi:hypothetical protein